MHKFLSFTLFSLLFFCPANLQSQLIYDGSILDHADRWDGYPVHLYVDGVHHMWFCAQSPTTGGDAIYHATNSVSLDDTSAWSTPVELFDVTDVPWAVSGGGSHACDPTILLGSFDYSGTTFSHALYFTSDTNTLEHGDNAIGVAFSHGDGSWLIHDWPVILPDGGYDGTYGAGASGVAWGPDAGIIHHAYRDSTTDTGFEVRIRYKTSTDGLSFSPTPSLDTTMSLASTSDRGSAPELAYYPSQDRWFGAIQAIAGGDEFTARLVKSGSPDPKSILSSWSTEVGFNGDLSGEGILLLPSMARTRDGTLFVTDQGWVYFFFATGNHPDVGDGVFTWKVGQARYRLFEHGVPKLIDSFQSIGPRRAEGSSLNGVVLETGAPGSWISSSEIIFHQDAVTSSQDSGSFIATAPFDPSGEIKSIASVEIDLEAAGSDWVAAGYSDGHLGLFGGELWALFDPRTQKVKAFADGLSIPLVDLAVSNLDPDGTDTLEIQYDREANDARIRFNSETIGPDPIDLDTHGFTPTLSRAGFHLREPTTQQTRVSSFLAESCDAAYDLDLIAFDITNAEVREACNRINLEAVAVQDGGDLTLRAGNSVAFGTGFSVATGGSLNVFIETP